MRALEFNSKIKNNHIVIPISIQSELKNNMNKKIRVIVLIDDSEIYDDILFRKSATRQFLLGYADSDSIYDLNQ